MNLTDSFNVNVSCSWLCVGRGLHRLISAYCQLLTAGRYLKVIGVYTLSKYITNLKRKASFYPMANLNKLLCNPVERSCPSLFTISSISISCWIPCRFATWVSVRCDANRRPLIPDICAAQTNSHTIEGYAHIEQNSNSGESYSAPFCQAIRSIATGVSFTLGQFTKYVGKCSVHSMHGCKGVTYGIYNIFIIR